MAGWRTRTPLHTARLQASFCIQTSDKKIPPPMLCHVYFGDTVVPIILKISTSVTVGVLYELN